MRRTSIILILIFVGLVSCKQNKQEKEHTTSEKLEFTKIIKDDYELYKPKKEAKPPWRAFVTCALTFLATIAKVYRWMPDSSGIASSAEVNIYRFY